MPSDGLVEWLAAWEYMPGWRFTVFDHDEGPVITIEFTVPDSRNPGETQDQRVWTWPPPMDSADQFYAWLKWRLARLAIHEVNEFARVNGERWSDPHLPLEQQVTQR